jgi:hypothetical protein
MVSRQIGRSAAHTSLAVLLSLLGLLALACLFVTSEAAASAGPNWSIRSQAQPTDFSSAADAVCEVHVLSERCDSYTLLATNVGSGATTAPTAIRDLLPAGISAVHVQVEDLASSAKVTCPTMPVRCEYGGQVPAGDTLRMTVNVVVGEVSPPAVNMAEISTGGAPPTSTSEPTAISAEPGSFAIQGFAMQPFDASGIADSQAGGHPQTLSTDLDLTTVQTEIEGEVSYGPPEEARDFIVDLPAGLIGNPLAASRCPLHDLLLVAGRTGCPAGSRVGELVFEAFPGAFRESENPVAGVTAIYNLEPEAGYPAEFGFTYIGKPVFMYANLVHTSSGYGLRVTAPGIPSLETIGAAPLFFGNPEQRDGIAGESIPFFTNPVNCGGHSSATLGVDSWQHPGVFHTRPSEPESYPLITGCNKLKLHPSLAVKPDMSLADEPSGYGFAVASPQAQSESEPGTPELKDVTVTLPPGVSLSPSAANGLGACAAEGPEGINMGSKNITPQGQDLGDPEATELGNGQGHSGESSYDDGLWHTAPGHCPADSTVASVEVKTPLLAAPLNGHLYLAQPGCGGEGQAQCTQADASDGNLVGMYLEAAGSGAIVKLRGSGTLNPATGQLSVTFREAPQLPFGNLQVHVHGGARAPLANPLACGSAAASAEMTPWSAPVTPDAAPASQPFTIDWSGAAGEGKTPGACPGTPPLSPILHAGMTETLAAGAHSSFALSLTREDRQQNLLRLSVTTPPGLLGAIAGIPLCEGEQASAGMCGQASEIGTTQVAVGPGPSPFWVTGHVYLTGSYEGSPFGLSVVVPAKAGPFNLGNVVVRAAIHIDTQTTALTIVSDPLPQVIDGVPLRVQKIEVDVSRSGGGFLFNPTNCEEHKIEATVAGAQGGSAQLSTPFTASGCHGLPFSPLFAASSQGQAAKASGAALNVNVAYKPGQANVRSVAVTLPKQLPARLTTIQQACPAAIFEANPATCPAGSAIGIATSSTPVLPGIESGPAYLVSHGGAAFPDVVLILQGDGVRVDLTGSINIHKGITSSTFASVPDVPITSFRLELPQGPHSALTVNLPTAAKYNLCSSAAKLLMPTTLTGQNGAVIRQNTKIALSGCPKAKKKAKKKKAKKRKRKK